MSPSCFACCAHTSDSPRTTVLHWRDAIRYVPEDHGTASVRQVCLVPLQTLSFFPPGQPEFLARMPAPETFMRRYAMLLRHRETLMPFFQNRPSWRDGMEALQRWAQRPSAFTHAEFSAIEAVFHHVARHALTYTKAVWSTYSAPERARQWGDYVLQLPGQAGEPLHIPLLQGITNRVLGYWGNGALTPLSLPASVLERMERQTCMRQDPLFDIDAHEQSNAVEPINETGRFHSPRMPLHWMENTPA